MQELQEIKLKVAEIKLASMEREFEKANSTYLQTIKTLKAMLSQKTEKQLKLLHELQNLKKDHAKHNQNVQETLEKIRPQDSPSKHSQKSLNLSKPNLRRLKLKEASLGQKSIDGKSDSVTSAKCKQEPSTGKNQALGKIKNDEFANLRKRHELLKQKNNLDGTLETPKKQIRGSYDIPARNMKIQSASNKWLRASQKLMRKEDGKEKKW